MAYLVELNLNAGGDSGVPATARRHWLLNAVYGRDLLKAKLRKVRPNMTVPLKRHAEDLDNMLDHMIDVMGLRDWPEPVSAGARVRYLTTVLGMMFAVHRWQALPDWKLADSRARAGVVRRGATRVSAVSDAWSK